MNTRRKTCAVPWVAFWLVAISMFIYLFCLPAKADQHECHEAQLPECFTVIGPPLPPEACEQALASCKAGTYKSARRVAPQGERGRKTSRAFASSSRSRPVSDFIVRGSSIRSTGQCDLDLVEARVHEWSTGKLEICFVVEAK